MKTPRLTAIASGKGGTGKTFLAINLAHALAREGERVLLCDADLGLSNTGVHLGLSEAGDLPALLSGKKALSHCVTRITTGRRGLFDLLAAPAGSGSLADADEPTLRFLASELRFASGYDRVLLDLGAGVDTIVQSLALAADELVLLLTPDPASLTDAYALAKLVARRGARTPSLVVNMTSSDSEGRRTADALIAAARNFLKISPEYLGCIPRDPQVCEAVRHQAALIAAQSCAPAARAISLLGEKLHSRLQPIAKLAASIR
jgi:flagellar biosynthesis protein FlhG